jgi:hypothetical protein
LDGGDNFLQGVIFLHTSHANPHNRGSQQFRGWDGKSVGPYTRIPSRVTAFSFIPNPLSLRLESKLSSSQPFCGWKTRTRNIHVFAGLPVQLSRQRKALHLNMLTRNEEEDAGFVILRRNYLPEKVTLCITAMNFVYVLLRPNHADCVESTN